MTQYAEVRFNDEEPLVLPAVPFPGDAEKIDYTATINEARRQRRVDHPERDEIVDAEAVVSVRRHVGESNTAIFGNTTFPDRDNAANSEDAEQGVQGSRRPVENPTIDGPDTRGEEDVQPGVTSFSDEDDPEDFEADVEPDESHEGDDGEGIDLEERDEHAAERAQDEAEAGGSGQPGDDTRDDVARPDEVRPSADDDAAPRERE